MPGLMPTQVESILNETVQSFPHTACLTCECFLGLVTQLQIDSGAESRALLAPYKVGREEMHACLGCDPCPPGNRYAKYMIRKQSEKLITL